MLKTQKESFEFALNLQFGMKSRLLFYSNDYRMNTTRFIAHYSILFSNQSSVFDGSIYLPATLIEKALKITDYKLFESTDSTLLISQDDFSSVLLSRIRKSFIVKNISDDVARYSAQKVSFLHKSIRIAKAYYVYGENGKNILPAKTTEKEKREKSAFQLRLSMFLIFFPSFHNP